MICDRHILRRPLPLLTALMLASGCAQIRSILVPSLSSTRVSAERAQGCAWSVAPLPSGQSDLWKSGSLELVSKQGILKVRMQLERTADAFVLVVFSPMGNRGLLIKQDSSGLLIEQHPALRLPLEAQELYRLLQLALLPSETLKLQHEHCQRALDEALSPLAMRTLKTAEKVLAVSMRGENEKGAEFYVVSDRQADVLLILSWD